MTVDPDQPSSVTPLLGLRGTGPRGSDQRGLHAQVCARSPIPRFGADRWPVGLARALTARAVYASRQTARTGAQFCR